MTVDQDQARVIAERIARRVSTAPESERSTRRLDDDLGAELGAMRVSLDNLRQKLVQLESRLGHSEDDATYYSDRRGGMTWNKTGSAMPTANAQRLSSTYAPAAHPSQERFGVEEATVAELVDFFDEAKKCELEPGGKPCDHCAMCSTRGF